MRPQQKAVKWAFPRKFPEIRSRTWGHGTVCARDISPCILCTWVQGFRSTGKLGRGKDTNMHLETHDFAQSCESIKIQGGCDACRIPYRWCLGRVHVGGAWFNAGAAWSRTSSVGICERRITHHSMRAKKIVEGVTWSCVRGAVILGENSCSNNPDCSITRIMGGGRRLLSLHPDFSGSPVQSITNSHPWDALKVVVQCGALLISLRGAKEWSSAVVSREYACMKGFRLGVSRKIRAWQEIESCMRMHSATKEATPSTSMTSTSVLLMPQLEQHSMNSQETWNQVNMVASEENLTFYGRRGVWHAFVGIHHLVLVSQVIQIAEAAGLRGKCRIRTGSKRIVSSGAFCDVKNSIPMFWEWQSAAKHETCWKAWHLADCVRGSRRHGCNIHGHGSGTVGGCCKKE